MFRRRGVEIEYREAAAFAHCYPQHLHAAFVDNVVQSNLTTVGCLKPFETCYRFAAHLLSPQ